MALTVRWRSALGWTHGKSSVDCQLGRQAHEGGGREAAVAQGLLMGCWQLLISKLLQDNSCYGLSHRRPLVRCMPQSAVN